MSDELLLTFTLFPDLWPVKKRAYEDVAWGDLVNWIREPPLYNAKEDAQLISFADYGDTIGGGHKCLRYAENVQRVYAGELDYDGEKVSIEDAAAMLDAAGVLALLHTSASHTPERPRWRVWLPFSEPALPEKRAEYIGRANRVLGGIAKRESFTLSQAFYVGRIRGRDYKSMATRGRPIDLLAMLEPLYPNGADSKKQGERDPTTDAELRAAFERGEDRYQAMLKLSSRWAARGMAADDIEAVFLAELAKGNPRNADGLDLRTRVRSIAESAVRKYGESRKARGGSEGNGQAGTASTATPASDATTQVERVELEDFYAYLPEHQYLFVPTGALWPSSSVNDRLPPVDVGGEKPIKPSLWLGEHRRVEQMTWMPGLPRLIVGKLVHKGGWIDHADCKTFNLYQPPTLKLGDANEAGLWRHHVYTVYPAEAAHIIRWLAHRVQHPGVKVNHALVLGGATNIGKDSILEPVKYAIGPWNWGEISPARLMGRFNGYVKNVILRVSEARDQGDAGGSRVDRYSVFEHCKTLLASPPDVLPVDEKNIREYVVPNVVAVVFTTNYRDGLYLPIDDRRHYVAWSETQKEDFPANYWADLYYWYENEGGYGHVAAYLAGLDLSDFDPKAPPEKTAGFNGMVEAGRTPEDAELADLIDCLAKNGSRPDALTVGDLLTVCVNDGFREWLSDRRNSRLIPHRIEAAGYVSVRAEVNHGLWIIDGKRQAIYARRELSINERYRAASARAKRPVH